LRWRPFHLALLIFEAILFNVVIPGHTRGIVQLPGSPEAKACGCCACCGSRPASGKTGDPLRKANNCAICFLPRM